MTLFGVVKRAWTDDASMRPQHFAADDYYDDNAYLVEDIASMRPQHFAADDNGQSYKFYGHEVLLQ